VQSRDALPVGEMYIADPRFAERYDRLAGGLAGFVHDAIVAYASRPASTPNGT